MLRLPPALRGLLAGRIFHSHGWTDAATLPALASSSQKFARCYVDALLPSNTRPYASISADPSSHRGDERPSPYPNGQDRPDTDRPAVDASSVLKDLKAGRQDIDDALYDAIEMELLLAFHRQVTSRRAGSGFYSRLRRQRVDALARKDPLRALRQLVLAQCNIPQSVQAKISARLGDAAHEIATNEWLELPGFTDFLQSDNIAKEQKVDAKELLDDLWSVRLYLGSQRKQVDLAAKVLQGMTSSAPLSALHKLIDGLPNKVRQRMHTIERSVVVHHVGPRGRDTLQRQGNSSTNAGITVDYERGLERSLSRSESGRAEQAIAEEEQHDQQNSTSPVTPRISRETPIWHATDTAEQTSAGNPLSSSSNDNKYREEATKQGLLCSISEPDQTEAGLEKKFLLDALRQVGNSKGSGDRAPLGQEIDDALQGQNSLDELRALAEREKKNSENLARRLRHSEMKVKMLRALTELDKTVEARVSSKDDLNEAKELLQILKRVDEFGGLQADGLQQPEALVQAVQIACRSPDPLNVLRLVALEFPCMPLATRIRTCDGIRTSGSDTALLLSVRSVLSQLHKRKENASSALATKLQLSNINHALDRYPMPAKEILPHAPPSFWTPSCVQASLEQRCRNLKVSLDIKEDQTETPLPNNVRGFGYQKYYTCNVTANIGEVSHMTASGDDFGKTEARSAAFLQLVSQMHMKGILTRLFGTHEDVGESGAEVVPVPSQSLPRDSPTLPQNNNSTTPPQDRHPSLHGRSQFFDLGYIRSTFPLPSREQYPYCEVELFNPTLVSRTIHNACMMAKISMESETDYTYSLIRDDLLQHRPQSYLKHYYFRCELKVDVGDLAQETAHGEGFSKREARQAAWSHMLSKLHVSGALAEILPGPKAGKRIEVEMEAPVESATAEAAEVHAVEQEDFELADVDERTKEKEKDAKIEIYNYAAGFGLVPLFETKAVQPPTRRARMAKTKTSKLPVRAVIKVDGLSIEASAVGTDFQTAEVAAALVFKRAAEDRHSAEGDTARVQAFRALNTDTAKQFFTFCNDQGVQMILELEGTTLSQGMGYQATLAADGQQIGRTVILRKKKDAQAVAYLTGALDIARRHPELLQGFYDALKKGNGKLLKSLKTINLELDPEAPQTMGNALAEAHLAGLPTTREVLLAETSENGEDTARCQPSMNEARIMRARQRLARDQANFDTDPTLEELRDKKGALPVSQYKQELLGMIDRNVYSIVVGATGSGKTTQVPQVLFEDAIRRLEGPHCNIICTQPRRIAATSVGRRVAGERNEPLRKTVGYHVRFDAQRPYDPHGITYCTTGILLERMKHDPEGVLDTTSHILIDEVHERDRIIDFLMITLKKAIRARLAEGKRVPRIVLMSATLDTELFANYFMQPDQEGVLQPAPCLSVPGRTFPVKEKYLGSIVEEIFKEHGDEVTALIEADPASKEFLEAETDMSSTSSGQNTARRDSMIDWKRKRTSLLDPDDEPSAKAEQEEALVPTGLLAATIAHICATTPNHGAVLAFLPGLEEIMKTRNTLLGSEIFGLTFADSSKFKVCLLHSSVPKEEQQEIFDAPPPGCRKIILSTNLAETSVTLADVKYVVDTGKLRETRYDQLRRITKLQCVWESKSNSKQRMGRAGRVQDGFYYGLFSKERAESLRAIGLPELLRSDLQETCLSIAAQRFNEPIASFLAQAIEPPTERAVDAAVTNLVAIDALTKEEELTALGRVLSSLPVHPTLGKMIILGAIFKCLDPMIALGAAAEERPLFVRPLVGREEATKIHSSYVGTTGSDQLAYLAAFKELRQLKLDQGMNAVGSRARQQFLHIGAFLSVDQTAQQIVQILVERGMIPAAAVSDGPEYGSADLNANANNSDLIKCLLLAGSYPNLAVKPTEKRLSYRSGNEGHAIMFPGSVNHERPGKKDRLMHPANTMFAYSTLSRGNDGETLFLRDTTKVTPLMVLLFGGPLRMIEDGRLEMDGWLPFAIQGFRHQYNTKLTLEFRKALERVLHRAYASLADLGQENGEGEVGGFANDPVRERFTQRVVEVLGGGSTGDKGTSGWRDGWGMS